MVFSVKYEPHEVEQQGVSMSWISYVVLNSEADFKPMRKSATYFRMTSGCSCLVRKGGS